VGAIVHTAFGAPVAEIAVAGTDSDTAERFTLPADYSWVAFAVDRTISLYGF
jgi:hypothetical protein